MNKTILVVDDEKMITEILAKIVQEMGYDTHICRNGREAVQYFAGNHHNIILTILDMIMPEMDGRETFRSIREIDPYSKILLVSGYSSQKDVRDLLSEGRSEFIEKPFRRAQLKEAITALISDQD